MALGLDTSQKIAAIRSLREFKFSTRLQNLFRTLKVKRVGDILPYFPSDLARLKGVGRRSINELQVFLGSYGLSLGCPIPGWDEDLARDWETALEQELVSTRETEAHAILTSSGHIPTTVGQELVSWVTSLWGSKRRNASIVCSLMGWDGTGVKTLEEVGQQYGLTRERVRQLQKNFFERIDGKMVLLPVTARALDFIDSGAPQLESTVQDRLINEKLIDSNFQLSGLFEAGPLVGRTTRQKVVAISGVRVIGPPEVLNSLHRTISVARAKVSHYGCVHIQEVADALALRNAPAEIIAAILDKQAGIRWLSPTKEWLTFDDNARNRLANVVRKVLTVSSPISVSELRSAISRVGRLDGFVPTRLVLKEFCNGLTFCRAMNDEIVATVQLDADVELADTERTFWRVLKRNGSVMSAVDLQRGCVEAGMNPNTFYQFLSYSPVIVRLARGVYALPGAAVSPGLVASLVPKYTKATTVEDHGWTTKGDVWIGYRLNRSNIRSGVFSVPAALKNILAGEYKIVLSDGITLGVATVKLDRVTGLHSAIRVRGGDEGDAMVLTFALSNRSVNVILGGEDLLEDGHSLPPPVETFG